jgi:hypothetical protein
MLINGARFHTYLFAPFIVLGIDQIYAANQIIVEIETLDKVAQT